MGNRLEKETSPYLRQHAENPVDWYPWCGAAFERARTEDKPVFVSIGYSTCHWCHVMAHESFEDEKIAEILNRGFISVKVDREERPDIDSVYIAVCQAFTGSGGWPMSIFVTWDKKPFFAGTYFPPRSRWGTPGFAELLLAVEKQWSEKREELLESAEQVVTALKQVEGLSAKGSGEGLVEKAISSFEASFDGVWGGFGGAPKFPAAHNLLFLMGYARRSGSDRAMEMAEKTLVQMRKGGIFDQIGGGFARYSTDRYFLAPHFEKMLYDNAWLMLAYTVAYHLTGKKLYLETAEETAGYILREMMAEEGGFYSAQDADSDGVEGKYYTFTLEEVLDCLGEERGGRFARAFDITPAGNFEGKNIPNLLKSGQLEADFREEKARLLEYRGKRGRLHLDDKVLTAWNAMAIGALAVLYRVTKDRRYLDAAVRAQAFLDRNLREDGTLYTSFCGGRRSGQGFLDDYAYEIAALIELYGATLEEGYLEQAETLCGAAVSRLCDRESGGFRLSGGTELFLDPKETYDGAMPSGNSMMMYDLVRLYQLTQKEQYRGLAERQGAFLAAAGEHPMGQGMFLLARILEERPPKRSVFVWEDPEDLRRAKEMVPVWGDVILKQPCGEYLLKDGKATVYVCEGMRCLPPTNQIAF